MNAPATIEGAQAWAVALRCGGQLRATEAGVLGFDMTAVLATARAMGVPAPAVAEFMPDIEAAMVRTIRETRRGAEEG